VVRPDFVVGLLVAVLAGCGASTRADRHVTALAQQRLAVRGSCTQDDFTIFWPAYRTNVRLFSCRGQRRGWCVLASPRGDSVADVTRFLYESLNRADADWAVRPACLRWPDVDRLRPRGGDPAVASIPARLYHP